MYGRDGKADEHVHSSSGEFIAGREINFFPPGAADGGTGSMWTGGVGEAMLATQLPDNACARGRIVSTPNSDGMAGGEGGDGSAGWWGELGAEKRRGARLRGGTCLNRQ